MLTSNFYYKCLPQITVNIERAEQITLLTVNLLSLSLICNTLNLLQILSGIISDFVKITEAS